KKTAARMSLHHIAEMIHKRSLVVIFSDMMDNVADDDNLFDSIQHLIHNKHEVILFHVLDEKHEIDFEFENRPYRFIGLESGEEMKLNPRSEEHTSELQSRENLVCRLLLEKKKNNLNSHYYIIR